MCREDARCPSRDLGWQSSGVVEVEVAFLHTCPIILNMITEMVIIRNVNCFIVLSVTVTETGDNNNNDNDVLGFQVSVILRMKT